MKISDVLTEAVPVSAPSNVGRDYINMLNFVKGSGLEGVPADQQVAVALFKELQKQQQKNTQLGRELSAAEKRIDQATQSGELYGQELATHQAELERERGEIERQREKMGQIDRQYAGRAQASEQQMRSLTDQLAQLESKPGVDKSTAETLQNQIEKLRKEGVDQEKFKELQKNIELIQNMQQVDDSVIRDLVAKIKSAEAAAAGAVQSKQELSRDIQQQLAHFKQVEQTVASLKQEVDDLEKDRNLNDQAIIDISTAIGNLRKAMTAGKKEPKPTPQPAAPQAPKSTAASTATNEPKFTPTQIEIGKKLGLSGDLQNPNLKFAESAFKRSIAWATGRTK
jgi:chromosome segregation ATPase